jgi:L-ascorbate metabolism protein UlaG (beta-lactamase superfamily)
VVGADAPVRFRDDVAINVAYEDRTSFGSPHGQGPDLAARQAFAPLVERLRASSDPYGILRAPRPALDALRDHPVWAAMTRPDGDGWTVRPEVLFPDPAQNRPRILTAARPDSNRVVRGRLPDAYWPEAHALVSSLAVGGLEPAGRAGLHPHLRQFVNALVDEDLLETVPEPGPGAAPTAVLPELLFLGHNTVLVSSATRSVMVDPLLFAHSVTHPKGYQPLQLRELERLPDAVAITHSHPDHFDPASLLRFPPATTVVVPWIERETFLSVDFVRRVTELGFTDVRALRWNERTQIGDITITAYPFYGEQPTDTSWIHTEVRNQGCTYRVDTPTASAVFLADSGVDHLGDARELALTARRGDGAVDAVFCGYRGWLTYPVQLLASSVARYFLLVPPDLWPCRMTLMATADMALDIAERWGARTFCAYADGGAPWHWRIGLGPRLDGGAEELFAFDPFPERVVEAAARRSEGAGGSTVRSPVDAVVLRPGQGLQGLRGTRPELVELEGHRWPF